MTTVQVISLGGSIISPGEIDVDFLRDFYNTIKEYLDTHSEQKLIIVCGGGSPARRYQQAYSRIVAATDKPAMDWIGIAATKLNAELVRFLFHEFCTDNVVSDPTLPTEITGRIMVASGWKPGFSTDYDAVLLAERFKAQSVINLSNIEQVYTADPKKDPQARPIKDITWDRFKEIVGDTWEPGKNVPFDPVATAHAARIGLEVVFAAGKDSANLKNILYAHPFTGTLIHP
ncbi:MAG: UMP kinase [Spirochaetia bacterium]